MIQAKAGAERRGTPYQKDFQIVNENATNVPLSKWRLAN